MTALQSGPPVLDAAFHEEALRRLNLQIRREQRRLGIYEHTDFNREAGVRVLAALRNTPTPVGHIDYTQGDEIIHSIADWHEPCLLSQYKDKRNRSPEAERDWQKPGVYVILEATRTGEMIPKFVGKTGYEFGVPRYVGESVNLSFRLWQHSTGRNSTPADAVTHEYLTERCTQADRERYWELYPSAQREVKESCMDRRRLWVKTTHTVDKSEAQRLENAVINLYQSQGIKLWNRILYKGKKAWR